MTMSPSSIAKASSRRSRSRPPTSSRRRERIMAISNDNAAELITEYVTVTIGDHLFGLPIFRVQDVFVPDRLTRVPLAPPEVAGMLNLRGRVVTAIDMRVRLDLGAA